MRQHNAGCTPGERQTTSEQCLPGMCNTQGGRPPGWSEVCQHSSFWCAPLENGMHTSLHAEVLGRQHS